MTQRYLLRWLQAAWWLKTASVLALVAVLAALGWLWGASPVLQQADQLAHQQRQALLRYRLQLQQLQKIPALSTLRARLEQLQAAGESRRDFSLPALLSESGARLQHWQPGPQGGELALTLQWPQFIRLLDYLTTLRAPVSIVRLSLHGNAEALRLLLTLVTEPDAGGAQ